jgi:hypothetical protein
MKKTTPKKRKLAYDTMTAAARNAVQAQNKLDEYRARSDQNNIRLNYLQVRMLKKLLGW